MRPGPATLVACTLEFFCLSPHGGGMTASARQRRRPCGLTDVAFAKASCRLRSCDRLPAALAVGQRPCPAPRSEETEPGLGEEAATPGQPAALARFTGVPRQIHPREFTGLPLALPLSFGKLRTSYVFRCNPLSSTLLRRATAKSFPIVHKVWTLRLPCGVLRKT